ncbi:MAG: ion channel [Candidatus Nanopelagicales bacterium]|jgi:ABC-type multidrug transport system permease subunit|nr:ion channel [Candidatus Nanopelagicales bacterium]
MVQTPPSTAKEFVRAGVPLAGAGLVVAAAILAIYAIIPEPTGEDPPWLVFLVIVVVSAVYLFAALMLVVRVNRSAHPLRTGIVALTVMVSAMVAIFSLTYLSLSIDNPNNFNTPLDKVSAMYFTMTILSTVGFGDIVATTHPAMIAVMVQMVVGVTLITGLARVLVTTARTAAKKRLVEAGDPRVDDLG